MLVCICMYVCVCVCMCVCASACVPVCEYLALLHEGDTEDPEEVGHDEGEDESVPVLLERLQLVSLLLLPHHFIYIYPCKIKLC